MKQTAVFGGGCFWCTEAVFEELEGVISVESGYSGGESDDPTYEEVLGGKTGHAEVVRITFDSNKISFEDLLKVFWATHDPTQLNRQGPDVGHQYRSVIFYQNEEQKQTAEESKKKIQEEILKMSQSARGGQVVTEISPFKKFYPAENYHQDFYSKNSDAPYCQVVINPKLEKLRKRFKDNLKE